MNRNELQHLARTLKPGQRVTVRRTDAMPLSCGISNTKNHQGEFVEATPTHLIVKHESGRHLCHFHTAIVAVEVLDLAAAQSLSSRAEPPTEVI